MLEIAIDDRESWSEISGGVRSRGGVRDSDSVRGRGSVRGSDCDRGNENLQPSSPQVLMTS